jgi:hypothetical protein
MHTGAFMSALTNLRCVTTTSDSNLCLFLVDCFQSHFLLHKERCAMSVYSGIGQPHLFRWSRNRTELRDRFSKILRNVDGAQHLTAHIQG